MQWQWNSSSHGRHSLLAIIIYSSCGQCYQSLQEICVGMRGEGLGTRVLVHTLTFVQAFSIS